MEDELYLENIDEFVTDQNRIVTYRWLSYTLGVHVNQAKQMLYDYVERKRKENSGAQLHVTYLVAGNLVQNGHTCHKVAVVREDKLEAMKSKLSTVASVHIYSIQKALLKDSGPLYNTDYDIIKANLQNCNRFSAIHCAAAVPRTSAEVSQHQASTQADSQTPSDPQTVDGPVVNGHAPSAAKQTSHQAKGIMGMFAAKPVSKSQDANKETKLESKEATAASSASSKAPAKVNAMSNFFGKAAMNKLKVKTESEQPKEERTESKPAVSVVELKSPSSPGQEKPRKKMEPAKRQPKDKRSRTKRVAMLDSEEQEAENLKKKRRRIKQPQSDSSEDEAVPESPPTPEVKEPSPPPEPARKMDLEPASTETSAGGKKRKRKRVLTSKTYVDEEGCMVTEKVYESASCSDSEGEFKPKLPSRAPKQPAAKREPREERKGQKKGTATVASKANKQASIMGFFQKK